MTIQEKRVGLIEKRKALLDANDAIIGKAAEELRGMTADETASVEANNKTIDGFDALLKALDRRDEQAKAVIEPIGRKTAADLPQPEPVIDKPTLTIPATAKRYTNSQLAAKGFLADDPHRQAYGVGMWIAGSLFGRPWAQRWCAANGLPIQNGMIGAVGLVESSNTDGGVLVPPEFEAAIIQLRQGFGLFRQYARRSVMAAETKTTPRKVSGLTAYFDGEGGTGTETQSGWDSVELVAKRLNVKTRMSNEILEDAIIDLAADTVQDFSRALALKEDQCGFLGDGTSTYGGIWGIFQKINDGTHAASIVTAATGGTAFSTLVMGDFEKTVGSLPLYPGIQPAWYVSQAGYWASMARLKDAAGGVLPGDLATGAAAQSYNFLGYPVRISQVLNSTLTAQTSTLVILFGDLSLTSTFGDRRGIQVMSNPYEYMSLNQTSMYCNERFDINNHNLGDSSAAGDFSTVGPMIALKTAAS